MAVLSQEDVAALLLEHWQQTVGGSLTRGETHNLLTRIAADLAHRFGLRAVPEYPLQYSDGRRGFIDVVWFSGSRPVVAFEVDSSRRKKSLRKLLTIPTTFRFWVYYGQKDPSAFVNGIDLAGRITVVCTHYTVEKPMHANANPITTSKTAPGILELNSADQHVRQAIHDCSKALPEEERSVERLDREMTSITRRALRAVKEDLQLLSGCDSAEGKSRSSTHVGQAEIRALYPRAYERWTEEDDKVLQQEFSNGASIQDLSELFQRRPSAIRSRLRRLGSR